MSTTTVTPIHDTYVAIRRRPARSEVRLTRRGRLVVFAATLFVVLAIALFAGAAAVGTDSAGEPAPTEIVTVAGGQTLWGIASELTPAGGDIHETIAEIRTLNALDGVVLDAGQRLRVPLAD